MNNFDEDIKNAIVNNDIAFLEKSRNQYDINYRLKDENNDTLLLYAISDKKSDAYRFFLENEADMNLINNEGEGIIHAIVYSGITERLIEFINNYTFNLNARDIDGTTPLLLSILIKKHELYKILIKAGADVNIGDNDNNTPLHMASWLGNFEIVKLLIDNGANLHVKTQKGNLPLALAVNGGHDKIVRYLFEKIYLQKEP